MTKNTILKNINKYKFSISDSFRLLLIASLVVYCFSLLIVLVWMIFSSLKTIDDYILNSLKLPTVWEWNNYKEIWGKFRISQQTSRGRIEYNIWNMATNSVIWAFGSSFINVFWMSVCGYIISKYKSKFTVFLFLTGVFVMVTPIVGSFPSAMKLYRNLNIYDNMLAKFIIGPSCSFAGMHFLIMYGIFKDMPKAYLEAVEIDGGGHFTAMLKVMFPIAFPSIVVLFVLNFLGAWNDYSTFLIWLPSIPNLAYGMFMFQQLGNSMQIGRPLIMAGFVIVSIPTIVLYILSQNLIISKFSVGGIKG